VAVATLFIVGSPIGLVPFFAAFAAGIWLYFGGAYRVAARQEGTTAGRYYLRHATRPWNAFTKGSSYWNWLGALLPSYFRRSARSLGWPEGVVLAVLGTLLVTDLVIFAWMIVSAPAGP
jgi:hypothetical protein